MTTPHSQILRLARSGSPERAWSLMEQHGLLDSDTDQRALTLQARLIKDRAKRADVSERARLFGEAAAVYAKAGALDQGSYPLINAASLSLLAGQTAQSQKLARDVLAALDANPDEAETPYWLGATRAEALLLLGQEPEARAALRKAVTKQPAAWEDHAATLGQFELLCVELDLDGSWLDQLRPPATMLFSGIMNVTQEDPAVRAHIDTWLDQENVGFGYGALAAGSDIWIAEALLDRGAELHVVLPCARETFRRISVTAIDEAWGARFDRLVDEATSFECLDHADGPSAAAVERGDRAALGLAIRRAGQLRTTVKKLRIVGEADPAPASTNDTAILKAKRLTARTAGSSGDALLGLLATKDRMQSFTVLEELAKALHGTTETAAIDWIVAHDNNPPETATLRLSAMLDCAENGQHLATSQAGFALLGGGVDIRVEAAGEMRWTGGQTPIFALI